MIELRPERTAGVGQNMGQFAPSGRGPQAAPDENHFAILPTGQPAPALTSRAAPDDAMSALAMAVFAVCLGYAIHLNNGFYTRAALFWLTGGLASCMAAVALPCRRRGERPSSRLLEWALAAGIAIQAFVLLARTNNAPILSALIVAIALLSLLQLFDLHRWKIPLLAVTLLAFLYAGRMVVNFGDPGIDVYTWQQRTSFALMNGLNPYEVRIENPYKHARFYAPGVVDQNGYLTAALPYPPLSLLMVLPGYALGGDIRFALLLAIAVSALLMALAQPEARVGALTALLFLITPRVFFILWAGWTEPVVLVSFSLAMFCACRWRQGLPWALGLFFATKQYTVLALPLLPLLVEGPARWRDLRGIVLKAGIVVAAINLPFLLWNIRAFTQAVVLLRVVPPFRADALSYSAWIYSLTGTGLPMWISLVVVVAAIALALWRLPHSPAGFAAAVTLVITLFFAFNKQAFCNYYYLTIATGCWSIAAAKLPLPLRSKSARASTT